MTLRDILHTKGHEVHTIEPAAALADVVHSLVAHRCGSLVVCERADGRSTSGMLGIITERDILKAIAAHGAGFLSRTVAEVMTAKVTLGSPDDSVEDAMGTMTELRIRHLPVVEGGVLMGMVSIGDVVKIQHDQLTMENHYLKSYLHDTPR